LPRIAARHKLASDRGSCVRATEEAIVAQPAASRATRDQRRGRSCRRWKAGKEGQVAHCKDSEGAPIRAPPTADLRGYDPAKEAAKIKAPLLFLQGGRDYQVTRRDFERFKRALGGKKGVSFTLYDSLNHLFIAGTGTIAPAEYERAGNVDSRVIDDIARFVESAPPRG
jgi:fermentation-respiration switch protein FrsA (DUF1100 family)